MLPMVVEKSISCPKGSQGRKGTDMTKCEHRNWITNIENSAAAVESQLGSAVVNSVFERYGAHSVEDLNPSDLPEVFSELYAIEADID